VSVKFVERFSQEMAKGYENQDETESDESLARAQAKYDQSPGNEFD
jgi:hypothetical protein